MVDFPRQRLEDFIEQENAEIDIFSIIPDERNVRGHYVKKELLPLAFSLAKVGQEEPVLVEKKGDKYYLVAGHRRYWATRLGLDKGIIAKPVLKATVTGELPEDLRLKIQIDENDMKRKIPSHRIADSLWGRYKISLCDRAENQNEKDKIHGARSYNDIPLYLRARLTATDFAGMLGRAHSTVNQAFAFQEAVYEVREEVRKGRLSFGIGTEFAKIGDKQEQRRILKLLKDSDGWDESKRRFKPRVARKAIEDYVASTKEDGFMKPIKARTTRSEALKSVSYGLKRANRLVNILSEIFDIDPELQRTSTRDYTGRELKTANVLHEAFSVLESVHQRFIGNDLYRKRWETKPRRLRLENMNLQVRGGKQEERIMDKAKFMYVNPAFIDENPLNPRGEVKEEDVRELADSINETGLIHPVILMEKADGRYCNLGGHRRIKAVKQIDLKRVRAIVLPELTKEQQLLLMYDEDIFENVDLHYRALGLARQFKLEQKRNGKDYSVADFCKAHRRWPRRLVADAVAYDSLPDEIKALYRGDLITYRVAIDLSRVEDKKRQLSLGKSAAIFGEGHSDIVKILKEDTKQGFLFGDKMRRELEKERDEGERRQLLLNIHNVLSGVTERLGKLSPGDVEKMTRAYDLTHRFQQFYRRLNEVYGVANQEN